MEMQITGKKMEVGAALRTQVENKVNELCKKYDLSPLETAVIFSKDGPTFHKFIRCDVDMHLGHGVYVRAHHETEEAPLSFEQAVEIFEKRIRRHKKKLLAHKHKRDVMYTKAPALQYVINAQDDKEIEGDNPLVIAEMKTDIPTLSVSEAVMHLDLAGDQALLFTNSAHHQLNVVYRRSDGNIGWITPTLNSR
jgi:ribosomal subunit interface protein